MRCPSLWTSSSSSSQDDKGDQNKPATNATHTPGEVLDEFLSTNKTKPSPVSKQPTNWSSFLHTSPTQLLTSPENLVSTLILTGTCLAFYTFYRSYLRRIPTAGNISPGFFRKRSLVGRVTSVGDGDNFRIFHTPGGRLAGWGWLPWRKVPEGKKELKDKTVSVSL